MLQVNQNPSESALKDWVHSINPQLETQGNQHQWIEAILKWVNDAVILTDEAGQIIMLNPIAERITGWLMQDAKYLSISEVFTLTQDLCSEGIQSIFEANQTQQDFLQSHLNQGLLKIRNSVYSCAIEYIITPIRQEDGQAVATAIVFRETQKSCHINSHSSWQINHDFLTGLINRPYFEKFLIQAVSSVAESDINHALCYLDFDHFKVINETLDYAAGDEFLRQISLILQQRIRKTDILARLGGDEFGLILCQCGLEQALSVMQTICQEIQAFKFIWKDRTFSFSISVGISLLSAQSHNPSQMLIAAKSACEVAKSKGRNRIHVYEPNDCEISTSQESIKWIPRLYKALEENQFCLYSQPIVSANSDHSTGVKKLQIASEILLRLKDESGRIIAPGCFIPVAERYGLMHLLDRWVIRNLLQYIDAHDAHTPQTPQAELEGVKDRLYMINLSGASLNDDQFLDFVETQFSIYNIPPQMICFEITETMAIANLTKAIHLMQRLKTLGCYFALDDFGSGMSSLGYLKSLPIDFLKIDGIFIKDIVQDQVDCEIVEAIHRMARAMGIQTIAEFVENSETLAKLETLGINYAQGYGIARPAPLLLEL
jgi:diguanylate cyclase (GGDEF)-like protein/PAS domain S-box-containing protein